MLVISNRTAINTESDRAPVLVRPFFNNLFYFWPVTVRPAVFFHLWSVTARSDAIILEPVRLPPNLYRSMYSICSMMCPAETKILCSNWKQDTNLGCFTRILVVAVVDVVVEGENVCIHFLAACLSACLLLYRRAPSRIRYGQVHHIEIDVLSLISSWIVNRRYYWLL